MFWHWFFSFGYMSKGGKKWLMLNLFAIFWGTFILISTVTVLISWYLQCAQILFTWYPGQHSLFLVILIADILPRMRYVITFWIRNYSHFFKSHKCEDSLKTLTEWSLKYLANLFIYNMFGFIKHQWFPYLNISTLLFINIAKSHCKV